MQKNDEEWRRILTPEQFRVLREKATEAPFSGEYDGLYADGVYACAACGQVLFDSTTKLMLIAAGRVFTTPSLARWSSILMKVTVWNVLK